MACLAERLVHELATGKEVVWLVTGGSNIPACVGVMETIPGRLTTRLTIILSDERYGPVGHQDSNYQQLLNAHFEPGQANFLPVLMSGLSLEETALRYDETLQQVFANANAVIGQFGIGEDGHIAGILPGSVATVEDDRLAIGYISEPFQRITLSFTALKRVTAAYAFAFGANKHKALHNLYSRNLRTAIQPAQVLKQLPEAYVYNDQVGDTT